MERQRRKRYEKKSRVRGEPGMKTAQILDMG